MEVETLSVMALTRTAPATLEASAVLEDGDGSTVYVLRAGKMERRPVKTGTADGNQVAVIDGLSEGDRVITNPTGLVDGQIVIVR